MDKYYVYRPMIELLGQSEGTAKGRGYNETLGYGIMLDGKVTKGKGPTVDLVHMTLDQVDKMQSRMLKDPDNKRLNSSAVGLGQIIRTTMRAIREAQPERYPGTRLFDKDCQDEMICYLLGQRGIDKWLAGRMTTDTLLRNLAQEWASIPKPDGKGHYPDQRAGVTVDQVMTALQETKRRHQEGQPKVEVPVDKPVVPKEIEKEVRNKTNWLTSIFGAGGLFTVITSWMNDANEHTVLYVIGGTIVVCVVMLIGGEWIVRRVKSIRKEIAA